MFTACLACDNGLGCVAVLEGTLVDSISHCTCTGFTVTAVLATSGKKREQNGKYKQKEHQSTCEARASGTTNTHQPSSSGSFISIRVSWMSSSDMYNVPLTSANSSS